MHLYECACVLYSEVEIEKPNDDHSVSDLLQSTAESTSAKSSEFQKAKDTYLPVNDSLLAVKEVICSGYT